MDNDIIQIHPPWWRWDNLGPDWKAMEPPVAPPGVKGTGSYSDFREKLKMLRDYSDKYILVPGEDEGEDRSLVPIFAKVRIGDYDFAVWPERE